MLNFIIRIVNSLFLKKTKQICFISSPDFSDSPRALYEYILKTDSRYQLFWLVRDKEIFDVLKKQNVKNILFLESIKGMLIYFTSKYIITSHSDLVRIKSKRQIHIDLWHGIPLKKIGYLGIIYDNWFLSTNKVNFRIATSVLTQAVIAASFATPAQKVKAIGQCRTDFFTNKNESILSKLQINKDDYKKIVLFLPTFRDFDTPQEQNIFKFDSLDINVFSKFLEDNNILFITKLHSVDEKSAKKLSEKNNFMLIKNIELKKNLIDIYQILNEIDILITDYSSVYIDFLLTNKPLIFIPTDIERYRKERGFIFEPYNDWTPGAKINTQLQLQKELEALVKNKDLYVKDRKRITNIFHRYNDNNSSKRTFELIKSGK